ncbi:MAG: GNAT family N-acetyltransferase [Gammaproteobacteria bacterium]|nr:GNAT family N-acetyltransferase [Gammaproteobacteria bacterium]
MKNKFTFTPLSFADVALMHYWFNLPHVQTFYSLRQWTEEQVLEKLKPYITGEKPVFGFIVLMNGKPTGYIQQYKTSDYPRPNHNLSQTIINNAAGIDVFIGDKESCGQGIGSQMINEFLKSKIWPQFQYCIVDPNIKNIAAIKCYEKLNFQSHAVVADWDALGQPVQLNLMVLEKC